MIVAAIMGVIVAVLGFVAAIVIVGLGQGVDVLLGNDGVGMSVVMRVVMTVNMARSLVRVPVFMSVLVLVVVRVIVFVATVMVVFMIDAGLADEWIIRRHGVASRVAVGHTDIDAQHLTEELERILRPVLRVVAGATRRSGRAGLGAPAHRRRHGYWS